MKAYIICPVRYASKEQAILSQSFVEGFEAAGHTAHYPPRDVNQDDPTGGKRICEEHREALKEADVVFVFWDGNSKGSHFDLGMAYALGKKIVAVELLTPDPEGKTYWKALLADNLLPTGDSW